MVNHPVRKLFVYSSKFTKARPVTFHRGRQAPKGLERATRLLLQCIGNKWAGQTELGEMREFWAASTTSQN